MSQLRSPIQSFISASCIIMCDLACHSTPTKMNKLEQNNKAHQLSSFVEDLGISEGHGPSSACLIDSARNFCMISPGWGELYGTLPEIQMSNTPL